MLTMDHGRGIDFKLKVSAKVLIIVNGKQRLTMQEAIQIAGRGDRAQGAPTAEVILTKCEKTDDPEVLLETNGKKNASDAHRMVHKVITSFGNLDSESRKLVASAMNSTNLLEECFGAIKDDKVLKWLEGRGD